MRADGASQLAGFQRPGGVEHRQDHDAHVREDRKPHVGELQRPRHYVRRKIRAAPARSGAALKIKTGQVVPARSRYRKVTIWARVQVEFGLKVVEEVPLTIPRLTAQATAWA